MLEQPAHTFGQDALAIPGSYNQVQQSLNPSSDPWDSLAHRANPQRAQSDSEDGDGLADWPGGNFSAELDQSSLKSAARARSAKSLPPSMAVGDKRPSSSAATLDPLASGRVARPKALKPVVKGKRVRRSTSASGAAQQAQQPAASDADSADDDRSNHHTLQRLSASDPCLPAPGAPEIQEDGEIVLTSHQQLPQQAVLQDQAHMASPTAAKGKSGERMKSGKPPKANQRQRKPKSTTLKPEESQQSRAKSQKQPQPQSDQHNPEHSGDDSEDGVNSLAAPATAAFDAEMYLAAAADISAFLEEDVSD